MIEWLLQGGGHLIGVLALAADLIASGHAVIRKREPRAAVLWVVVIWFMPFAGALVYLLFGINRVKRRAIVQRRECGRPVVRGLDTSAKSCAVPEALRPLATLGDGLVPRPLVGSNRIVPLVGGEQTYPAMLSAIDGAVETIALASYIFERQGIGAKFIEALGRAAVRGVQVRVLLDDTHVRLSRRSAFRELRKASVAVGVFNPKFVPARFHAIQLRNHAKILVVDARLGFTGGMNIAEEYWDEHDHRKCSKDLHFRLEGPVVAHLVEVFAADWHFATDEVLSSKRWFPSLAGHGNALCRGIESGPDHNFERVRCTILGALSVARTSVRIMTPYFLPDPGLIAALNIAAMRGVQVDILLPERSDVAMVRWATNALLWQVLESGCRIWFQPAPFDHSKLLVVDDAWVLLGSANWDARSLRLNFEFNVECYSAELGARLSAFVESRCAAARRLTTAELNARPLLIQLRDGVARLFAPYL